MRLPPPPAVPGTGCALRPLAPTDVDAWYAYLSRPDVAFHTSWQVTSPDVLAAIVDACGTDRPDAPVRYAVVDEATGALAGTIGFPVVSDAHRTAELAYDYGPDAWGRGLATACRRAVTDWALSALGWVRVSATTLDTNVASRRVLEKCGFRHEGLLENLKHVRGRPRDFHLFAKTRTPAAS